MSSFVSIENLSIAFDEKTSVVNNVNINIEKGERVAIVGESGSGKTLSSLSLLQLLPKESEAFSSGKISININGDKIHIDELNSSELGKIRGRKIAMIFQEPMSSLDPVFKCGFQVDEVYKTHLEEDKKKAKERTLQLFKLVQLDDPERIYDSYPHEISGGQIQRVMIAMALVCNPDLLIADEPTTALDVTIQKEIISLLRNLSDQLEMALLFISHDLALVSQISEKVYVMYKGDIVEEGLTKSVFGNPEHPYTQALLNCRPSISKRDHVLSTVSDVLNNSEKPADTVVRNFEKEVVLRVQNLSKTYSKSSFFGLKETEATQAVKDVSFELRKKEILGIVGESGSGKSTLIKCILGVEKAEEGSIEFENKDLLKLSRSEWKPLRKRIQIIFQDPYSSLNPKMKIGDAVREALQISNFKGDKTKRVKELFELVSIPEEFYDRYPFQLSGGQRQRICIARALAMEPEILLCDESVSALDVSVQAQVLNLLLKLRSSQDLSIVFITHDFSVVSYLSDRIIVMQNGEIVEDGLPVEIINSPMNDYTKKLIGSIPKFKN